MRCSGEKGYSLPEIMIASAVLLLLTVMFYPIIKVSQSGSVKFEAGFMIKKEVQKCLLEISHRLVQSKRVFGRTDDIRFLTNLSGQTPELPNSLLPLIQINATPGAPGYPQASVGNALLFASQVRSQDLDLVDANANAFSARIDIYRFYCYFLTVGETSVSNKPARVLYRWESVDYADFSQINTFTAGPSLRQQMIVQAFAALGLTHAWNPSQIDYAASFFKLKADGTMPGEPGAYEIERLTETPLMTVQKATSGYRYGVAPNTDPATNPKHPVPLYTVPNGDFPSGFEVMVGGISSNRQVFYRLVLAAESTSVTTISVEQAQLTTVRDVW